MRAAVPADPLHYSARWRVRSYELDGNGHVNNAVYFSYAEALTNDHAEAAGYGKEWASARGGAWVIHRNEAVYHRPAVYADELELTVRVELVKGVRGVRRTSIIHAGDGGPVAEIRTEWVWTRVSDGRPARVPSELVEIAAGVTAATLARRRSEGRVFGRRQLD